jgi:signal transduction histidine kinase
MREPELLVFGRRALHLGTRMSLFARSVWPRLMAVGSIWPGCARGGQTLLRLWLWPWLRVGAVHAVLETLASQIVLTLGLLGLGLSLSDSTYWQIIPSLLILDGPCCILWCAVRLRLPVGVWWRRVLHECVVATALALALLPMLLLAAFSIILLTRNPSLLPRQALSFSVVLAEGMKHSRELRDVFLALFVGGLVLFLLFRVGVRLWLRWNRMRRARLLWALTHAHLVVVVIGAVLLGAMVVGVGILTSAEFPFYLLSVFLALVICTGIALAVVLPPSALFSYLFSRRMTRRLEGLASATSALSQGDYGIRVPVKGEDEIARLQSNFNAMAADLERTMRELQAERDAVATLLKARRELVASVSHELRTPIATLRGYLESTRTHWDEAPPPTLRQDLQIMEQETIRLQTLIDDLFTLSRAEVGKLEVRCQSVDAGALACRVAETMAPLAWQAGRVEVIAAVACDAPLVFVDPCRLEQSLQNLAHNGVRHTPPGGIVALLVQDDADSVILQVRDTGEGIASADLPRIWERFYRAENRKAHPDTGSGLGLALVKELTEAMGGTVAVESTPGEGSCFTLCFPRAASSHEAAPLAEPESPLRLLSTQAEEQIASAMSV